MSNLVGGGVLTTRYIPRDEANAVIRRWHQHHKPVRSHYFAAGAFVESVIVGVVIVGRPVAPALCDGVTCEVTRLCTSGNFPHAASKLLGAAWAAARALGFRRGVSYTRQDEVGTCYRAAGWVAVARVNGRGWDENAKPGRYLPGLYLPTTEIVDRVRWEIGADSSLTRYREVAR